MSARRSGQRAFTLLDVLMAILVMTIGLTGLLAMEITAVQANGRAREIAEATQLARSKIEELRLVAPALPVPPDTGDLLDARGCVLTGDSRAFCFNPPAGNRYLRAWRVDPAVPNRVEVRTSWETPDGRTHTVMVSDVL